MLKDIRDKIDGIDSEINSLLDKRAELAKQIGDIKKEQNKPVFAPEREHDIINKIVADYKGRADVFPLESRINIFKEIFAASRLMQKKLAVSFLGPDTTFTHQAAVKQFSKSADFLAASSITQVFRDVEKKRADYGVVPIENSTEGIVSHTLDMFLDSECKICAELLLAININLLSLEEDISKIKKVFSHPQPLAQSRTWLEEKFTDVQFIEVSSTAKASEMASKEKGSAAVASALAAEKYNLNILAENIEDVKENITRFFVIGRQFAKKTDNSKTSIMFSIKDKVGALHDILVPFKNNSINLTKIESRPSRAKVWEYVFFVDMIGYIEDKDISSALKELSENCVFIKVLGSYPSAGGDV